MPHGRQRPGGSPSMMARAVAQASEGATTLFARLDAADGDRMHGADVLERWAQRLRAGTWGPEVAELVAQATRLEQSLHESEEQ